jgi:hypothetical protein
LSIHAKAPFSHGNRVSGIIFSKSDHEVYFRIAGGGGRVKAWAGREAFGNCLLNRRCKGIECIIEKPTAMMPLFSGAQSPHAEIDTFHTHVLPVHRRFLLEPRLLQPFIGGLADRHGRKAFLMSGLFIYATVAYSYSPILSAISW